MAFRHSALFLSAFWGAAAILGCTHGSDKICYLGDAELRHYRDSATRIDYANVREKTPIDVIASEVPRTVGDRRRDEVCDVTVMEMLHVALANNRIIRSSGQFLAPGNPIYTNNVGSVYDPAIQDSGVLFGGRGVEAALADFDAQFSTNMLWGREERIANSRFIPGLGVAPTIVSDTGAFRSRLQKVTAYGAIMGVNHNWDYLWNNTPGRLFPSDFNGLLSMDYRQPLWAGSGAEFTRIAGPINPNFGAITGVSQGVVIARINQDISLADFEAGVRNMLKDVEDNYWDLYLAYRRYDTVVTARNSALKTWRDEEERRRVEAGDPGARAQALDQYFAAKSLVAVELSSIYNTELRLRRLCGMPVNDGKILRPIDEPSSAEFVPDWYTSLAEALTRRVELRRQKWNIKSLELQLVAAKSLTTPKLDFVSQYRVNAFGNELFGENDSDALSNKGLRSAYERLTEGDETGWNLGFEFSMPLGFRSALAQVRNIELRLLKAREVLAVAELDISHELANSFQAMSVFYQTARDNFNRRDAAAERVRVFTVQEKLGAGTVDLTLRAQTSLAQADIEYYTSLVNFNKAITDFYFRKGTLLEHNNVSLAEDRWKPEAYKEALRRAWARSHAIPNPCLNTEPPEFATHEPRTAPLLPTSLDVIHEDATELSPPPSAGDMKDPKGRETDIPGGRLPVPPAPETPQSLSLPPAPPALPDPMAEESRSAPRRNLWGTTTLDRSSAPSDAIRRAALDEVESGFETPSDRTYPRIPTSSASPRPSGARPGVPPSYDARSGRTAAAMPPRNPRTASAGTAMYPPNWASASPESSASSALPAASLRPVGEARFTLPSGDWESVPRSNASPTVDGPPKALRRFPSPPLSVDAASTGVSTGSRNVEQAGFEVEPALRGRRMLGDDNDFGISSDLSAPE